MADDGASKFEIADALDHTGIGNVYVYTMASPEIVSRLNPLTDDLAPIMQAFAGTLLCRNDNEAQMAPKNNHIVERSLEKDGENPLGHCGQYGWCDLARPVACYTCRSFRPWDDGPHEQILALLLAERQRKIDRGLGPKIFTIRDRTITAVRQVVQLCQQRQNAIKL